MIRFFKWLAVFAAAALACIYGVSLQRHGFLYVQSGVLKIQTGEYHFSMLLDGMLALEWLGAAAFSIYFGTSAFEKREAPRWVRALAIALTITALTLMTWSAWVERVLRFGLETWMAAAIGALSGWLLTMRDGPGLWLAKMGNAAARMRTSTLVIAGFVLGAAACVLSWLWVFRGQVIMTDAQSQISQARLLLTGHFTYPIGQAMRDAIEIPYALPSVPSYSQYPPGHILALAPLLAAGLPAQLLNVFAAGVMVALAGWVAMRLGGRGAGVAAIIMLAGSTWLGIMGGTAMNHMTCAALTMVTLGCWLPFLQNPSAPPRRLSAAIGGLALGWIVCTRPPTGLAYGLVWGAALLMAWISSMRRDAKIPQVNVMRITVWGAAGLVIPAAVFIFYNLQTTGVAFRMAYSASNPTGHVLGFREAGPAPYSPRDALHHFAASVLSMNDLLLGWAIGSWTGLLLWWRRTKFSAPELLLVGLVAAQFICYGLYHFFDLELGPRFLFELLGPVAVLAALGLAPVLRRGRASAGAALLVVALLAFGGIGSAVNAEASRVARLVYPHQKIEAFMKSVEPRRRPTVVVLDPPYNEMIGRWFPAIGHEPPIYFVQKSKAAQARALPELQGFEWVEFK